MTTRSRAATSRATCDQHNTPAGAAATGGGRANLAGHASGRRAATHGSGREIASSSCPSSASSGAHRVRRYYRGRLKTVIETEAVDVAPQALVIVSRNVTISDPAFGAGATKL